MVLMDALRSRLANRVQLTTDGHRAYLEAVEGAFGADVDYAQFVKLYGELGGKTRERRYTPVECVGARKVRRKAIPISRTSARRTSGAWTCQSGCKTAASLD